MTPRFTLILAVLTALIAIIPSGSILINEDQLPSLQEHLGKEVTIRGFVVPSGDNSWAVCSEPPIKSCCQGKIPQNGVQVVLEGEWAHLAPGKVVEFRGKLMRIGTRDDFTGLHLLRPRLITHRKHNGPFYTWLVGSAFFVIGFALLWRRMNARY